ncbi:MAG: hypothetical protein M1837_002792 [Sclerophora amabilis]|nr:MAG: hypothetical protein M1837_002792 [Sclerophora amabilis]
MASTFATVGILSIGEMGLGIAKLLQASNYRVLTNVADRSEDTHQRARAAKLGLVATDEDLAHQSDYILSIVPPRDALSTARRVIKAAAGQVMTERRAPLFYIDLNAISPRSAREMAALFPSDVRFLDGGIIGPAPRPPKSNDATTGGWTCPSLVVSGSHKLEDAPGGQHLAETLNVKHIAPTVSTASALKMCFASMTKGFLGIATQSFTTAHRLGVLVELREHLAEYSPKTGELAESGLVSMPPKAYRWVREMREIGETFKDDGGWGEKNRLFEGVEDVYRTVADETVLGSEKTGERIRGKDVGDVALCLSGYLVVVYGPSGAQSLRSGSKAYLRTRKRGPSVQTGAWVLSQGTVNLWSLLPNKQRESGPRYLEHQGIYDKKNRG